MPDAFAERPLRVLTFTTLYPSAVRPRHGIFVETRLRHLLAQGGVDARVIAPVPWFPSGARCFGEYATWARTPSAESRSGIEVLHPRYAMVPKIGMVLQPRTLAATGVRAALRLRDAGFVFDVIDAHYLYPDGVAAARMAARLGVPFVVTARGSDLNLIAELPHARRRILAAARAAERVICVSSALRERAIAIGMDPDRVEVLRNGVDTSIFVPRERAGSRRALGVHDVPGPLLLAVGNLAPEKGHALAVEALARLPDAFLLIVGEGRERARLLQLAREHGVGSRMRILDAMPQQHLAAVYSAADVMLLPSLREGWPNVVLEAMACGTPVITGDVGGAREIVGASEDARVLPERTPAALVRAVRELMDTPPDRERLRRHAMQFDWVAVAERQRELLCAAAGRAAPRVTE